MLDIYHKYNEFKSFEIIFFDEENTPAKLYCRIKNIEQDKIIITANKEKNQNTIAPVGTCVKLFIYTDNGIYSSESVILNGFHGNFESEYIVAYPQHCEHCQRREYFRAEIPVEFKMHIYATENYNSCYMVRGVTKNICGKGLCFISQTQFYEHDSIEFELFFKNKTVRTVAEIVYTQDVMINDKKMYLHAFTFKTILQNDIDFIVKTCFLHQLEHKKTVDEK